MLELIALFNDTIAAMRGEAASAGSIVVLHVDSTTGPIGPHVYVISDRLRDLDLEMRTDIVFDAYRVVFPERVAALQCAMGYTPKEADAQRLKWRA